MRLIFSLRHAALTLSLLAVAGCASESDLMLGGGDSDVDEHETGEVLSPLTIASPVPGRGITTPFGRPGSFWAAGYHTGDDYATPTGTQVVSTRAGRIIHAGWGGWGQAYGLHVIVDSGSVRHLYAHLSRLSVSVGQSVNQGTRLGSSGATGNVTGPHVHYEERVSPYGYFNHRRPQFNHASVSGGGGGTVSGAGYLNWKLGAENGDIEGLQRALESAGCDVVGGISNTYGSGTRAAVTCFQRKQGWSGSDADGIVGPVTAQKLWLTGDVYVNRLQPGVTGSDSVRMLQQRLNEVRNINLPITGNYNAATRDAVRAWQLSIGDTGSGADGAMGPMQSKKLFSDLRYDVQ